MKLVTMNDSGPIHHGRFRSIDPGSQSLLWLLCSGVLAAVGVVGGSMEVTAIGLVATLGAGILHVRASSSAWRSDHRVASLLGAEAGAWAWRLDDGTTWFDEEFRRLAGIERDDAFARFDEFIQRIHPEDLSALHPVIEGGAAGEGGMNLVLRVRGDDDEWRTLRLIGGVAGRPGIQPAIRGIAMRCESGVDAPDPEARNEELVGVLTELARANGELDEARLDLEQRNRELDSARIAAVDATRSKSEFLANMSHEIRTPLGAIIGNAEILAHEGAGLDASSREPGRRREFVETIHRNGEHLLALVSDVLDLSKMEASRMEITPVPTDVTRLSRDVVSMLRGTVGDRPIEIRVEAGPEVPSLLSIDPVRYRQVLLNLVGNAIKFTERGSIVIAISWDPTSERMRTSVSDTGIGMDESVLERIFHPFRQADGSTTRRFGGTGLGLAISREICGLMDGDLLAKSKAGVGSTFQFEFPAAVADPPLEETEAPDIPEGLRILLAEDGPDNQRLVCHLLGRLGATVETAVDGQEAVDRILGGGPPFDLVLMDMQMPVMDGWEATRRLRNAGSEARILALTANAMPGDRDACLEAGCDGYLAKPVRMDDLARAVAEVFFGRASVRRAG